MTTETITIRPSQVRDAIITCIEAQQPVFVSGGPGIGKSQIFRQIADQLYAKSYGLDAANPTDRPYFRDIRAALHDPVDFTGMPHLHEGKLHFAPSAIFPDKGAGLVFFDELNRAPVLTQNACFQFILDRKSGNYTLPSGWACAGAGNRESDGGGVMRMPQALANRFIHFNLEPNVDDWCTWAVLSGIEPLLIAFIRFRPNLLYEFSQTEHAFPTPRSWEFVNRVITKPNDKDLEMALVAGAVGHGAAVEFISFLQLYRDLPNLDHIEMHPDTAPVPENVATQFAISSALANRLTANNLERIIKYLDRLPTEYAVSCLKDALLRNPLIASYPAFTVWGVKHADVLR